MSLDDTRSLIPARIHYLPASGATIRFHKDGNHYIGSTSGGGTAVSCPAFSALPIGLRFTLDNSNGAGSLVVTPTTGSAITVAAGKVYDCVVAANGSIKAGELAAAP